MNPIGTVVPDTVAANVLDAIHTQRPYVFTDDFSPESRRSIRFVEYCMHIVRCVEVPPA